MSATIAMASGSPKTYRDHPKHAGITRNIARHVLTSAKTSRDRPEHAGITRNMSRSAGQSRGYTATQRRARPPGLQCAVRSRHWRRDPFKIRLHAGDSESSTCHEGGPGTHPPQHACQGATAPAAEVAGLVAHPLPLGDMARVVAPVAIRFSWRGWTRPKVSFMHSCHLPP